MTLIPQLLIFYFVFMILLSFKKPVQNYLKPMSVCDEEYLVKPLLLHWVKNVQIRSLLVRIQENADQKTLRIFMQCFYSKILILPI